MTRISGHANGETFRLTTPARVLKPINVLLASIVLTASLHPANSETKQHRSAQAIAEFKREHPCPVTGRPRGVCHGWIIDHITPLACGGADAPSNMQWQTETQAAAKDKWERKGCTVFGKSEHSGMDARGRDLRTLKPPPSDYFIGPKGGCFTYMPSGRKRYVAHSYCGG